MREPGIPKLLTWRWAPCAALALGALSFCGFALLAIPEHIGGGPESGSTSSGLRLGNQLSRTQVTPPTGADFGNNAPSSSDDESEGSGASTVTHLASRASGAFPKRGFTPPLDRPATQAAAPPPPAPAVPAPPPTPEPVAQPVPAPVQADAAAAAAPAAQPVPN